MRASAARRRPIQRECRTVYVEIVEPTLVTEAGHCAALFASLRGAAPTLPYRLWIDRRAHLPGIEGSGVPLRRYFSRRWRKLQAPWLYRQLLRAQAPILVPTATWLDLLALDLVSGGRIGPRRVFLYLHKWRASPGRAAALHRLALRQPELQLFGTSEAIVQAMRAAGFAHVEQIEPVLGADFETPPDAPFRGLLCAGAARADKGFALVVDLVEHLHATGSNIPITVQASGDHYGRFDEHTRADLQRLRRCGYAHLTVLAETLDAHPYQRLFAGTICLQPYGRQEYADKMSAITFDALRSGAPIVTVAGTTMAAIAAKHGCGIVLDDATPQAMLRACLDLMRQYDLFTQRARLASAAHSAASAWRPLVQAIERSVGPPGAPGMPGRGPAGKDRP